MSALISGSVRAARGIARVLGAGWSLTRAGWGVWRAWGAVREEGIIVDDPRTLKQAQTLASSLPPLLSAIGLAMAPNWINAIVTAVLLIYGAWNGRATLASTEKLGSATLFSGPGERVQPGGQASDHELPSGTGTAQRGADPVVEVDGLPWLDGKNR